MNLFGGTQQGSFKYFLFIYLFTCLTRKVSLRSISLLSGSPGQDRQQKSKLQRNTHHHTMNKHKTQFSKNNTNPSQLLKHVHCSI